MVGLAGFLLFVASVAPSGMQQSISGIHTEPTRLPRPAAAPRSTTMRDPYAAAVKRWQRDKLRCAKRRQTCFLPHPNSSDYMRTPGAN